MPWFQQSPLTVFSKGYYHRNSDTSLVSLRLITGIEHTTGSDRHRRVHWRTRDPPCYLYSVRWYSGQNEAKISVAKYIRSRVVAVRPVLDYQDWNAFLQMRIRGLWSLPWTCYKWNARSHIRKKNISQVLIWIVNNAVEFFQYLKIQRKLQTIKDVGLGYVTWGTTQVTTLSCGEVQQKLAMNLQAVRPA